MTRWYVVCCKPRQESIAQENLLRQGYHVYLPRLQTRKRRCGKWVDLVEALFPRYLFLRINPSEHSTAPVRSTRGAVGLVRFGTQPAIVPDDVVATIRQREDGATGLHEERNAPLREGTAIELIEGPLAGMEGIFCQQDGAKRVVVLLELLGTMNRVTVSREWVAEAA